MESIKLMEWSCCAVEGRVAGHNPPHQQSAPAINSINFILIPLIKFDLADFVDELEEHWALRGAAFSFLQFNSASLPLQRK